METLRGHGVDLLEKPLDAARQRRGIFEIRTVTKVPRLLHSHETGQMPAEEQELGSGQDPLGASPDEEHRRLERLELLGLQQIVRLDGGE